MKLLHKTLRVYILFSLVVLVISAPLFYFFTEKLFIEDADEALFLHKKEFFTYSLPSMSVADVPPIDLHFLHAEDRTGSPLASHPVDILI